MKETACLQHEEISFNKVITLHKSKLSLIGSPLQLVGTTPDHRKWHIILPMKNSLSHTQPESNIVQSDHSSFNDFFDFCQNNHPTFVSSNPQDKRHLITNAFIIANWNQIVTYLSPHPKYKPSKNLFCIPEVNFFLPKNQLGRTANFSVDCIGSDHAQNIYVIEVGSRRKLKQNTRQIYQLEKLYPYLHFTGLIAYYDFNHTSTKITLKNGSVWK
ncbi:MAG TPA: hypothetical protein VJB63_00840 [Patescibacteria group bacterium]|nr:hypothetical protein [Patescibacteria group bacterium]